MASCEARVGKLGVGLLMDEFVGGEVDRMRLWGSVKEEGEMDQTEWKSLVGEADRTILCLMTKGWVN